MSRKGHLFVLSGPSGVGKSTIRDRLVRELGIYYSISSTTRSPRAGEIDGVDYEFISEYEFEGRIAEDEFIEWARVYDYFYGTPKSKLLEQIDQGKDVVLEIDVQGARQIRQIADQIPAELHFIFVEPPSLEVLKERLTKRGTDASSDISKRIQTVEQELSHADDFDLVVVNDDFDETVSQISKFIIGCRVS